jgi:hypothetical protein
LRFVQSNIGGLISIASAWQKADIFRTWSDPVEIAIQATSHLAQADVLDTIHALQTPLVDEELNKADQALDQLLTEGYKRRLSQALDDADTIPEALERIRREGNRIRRDEVPSLEELLAQAIHQETSSDNSGFQVDGELLTTTGAYWLNNWAGSTKRFTAGSTILLGGASSSGKTTVGNIFALSALAQGLPVFFYQAELAPWRHLRDLLILRKKLDRKEKLKHDESLPATWVWQSGKEKDDLLQYPSASNSIRQREVMFAALESWADKWERRLAESPNTCKGVLVVDYIQLIKDESARSDYSALETIASELAQFAATRSVVVVILSQVSKGDQREIGKALADALLPPKDGRDSTRSEDVRKVLEANAETFFAGADIRRVADVAIAIMPLPGTEDGSGNKLRTLVVSKDRGHSWSAFEEGGKRVLSFRMSASGTFQDVAYGVSGLPDPYVSKPAVKPKPAIWHNKGLPANDDEVP